MLGALSELGRRFPKSHSVSGCLDLRKRVNSHTFGRVMGKPTIAQIFSVLRIANPSASTVSGLARYSRTLKRLYCDLSAGVTLLE